MELNPSLDLLDTRFIIIESDLTQEANISRIDFQLFLTKRRYVSFSNLTVLFSFSNLTVLSKGGNTSVTVWVLLILYQFIELTSQGNALPSNSKGRMFC